MYRLFAVTQPGLEPLLRAELNGLGLITTAAGGTSPAGILNEDGGGVAFEASPAGLYTANLQLRTASRVLVRLGEFGAQGFEELKKKAARLHWEQFLLPGQPVSFRVTCHKSRLYHSDAVAREILAALNTRLSPACTAVKYAPDAQGPSSLIVVRIVHDVCAISVDSSGDALHRRGYRLETAKAPLRETLAAAMLLASGWDAHSPLVDPFCGSGTIPIEAALLARRIAPGKNRAFSFFRWPGFDARIWQKVLAAAIASEQTECAPIYASDRDEGALRVTLANAERAGVAGNIQVTHAAVSNLAPPAGRGWMVSNPPYGERVSRGADLRNLYTRLGDVLRERCSGWRVSLLCEDPMLAGHTRLPFTPPLPLVNGGLRVGLFSAGVPERHK
jgi:putative N6-adenine-specific DNA methylase